VNGVQVGTTQNISAVTGSLNSTDGVGIGTIPDQLNFLFSRLPRRRARLQPRAVGGGGEAAIYGRDVTPPNPPLTLRGGQGWVGDMRVTQSQRPKKP